jgi:hypothetical protein
MPAGRHSTMAGFSVLPFACAPEHGARGVPCAPQRRSPWPHTPPRTAKLLFAACQNLNVDPSPAHGAALP